MSEDTGMALKMAIKALLLAAAEQGVHFEAICEGAIQIIERHSGMSQPGVVAVSTIQRLAYDVSNGR